ncbi:MAG: DUF2779 domain-containing protein [Clostridiales bacterium]|nr:DUF2779 domain-containing protein [Clostridiales bacterium]
MLHLSKSKYCSGLQCPKMLWLGKNMPEAFDESILNKGVLDAGSDIGDLAMGLLGEYTEVPYSEDLTKMLEETQRLIDEGVENICEASLAYNGLFCSVDILKNLGDKKVEIYEVKSSTHVHDPYPDDVAYQHYVLKNLGFDVKGVYIVHINNKYVRHGELELDKLFEIEDMTEEARARYDKVEETIKKLEAIMADSEEPNQEIGEHCFKPYECGYWKHCTAKLPTPNVFDLGGIKLSTKLKYYNDGMVSYKELLQDEKLNNKVQQQIKHEINDLPDEIDKAAVEEFLDSLWYPLYFLDFESFTCGVPKYDNSSPYQQICFQYSLHYIEEKGGALKHKEFLAYPGKDPRRELCERLCEDIPLNACTMVYNKSFEPSRIKEMMPLVPELQEHLTNICDNMVDLMVPFSGRKYYNRAMQGSYSIKYVLPALFPGDPALDYHNLEGVHNGGEASATFLRMETMSPEELEEYRGYLLKYCGLDTYAMVKVWEKLKEVAGR